MRLPTFFHRLAATFTLLAAAIVFTTHPASAAEQTILFIGNSFTFADKSPVHFFHPETVTDLNKEGNGGVPALFKVLTDEAALDYDVSLLTAGGQGLDYHLQHSSDKIGRPWDVVVMHGFSTLDAKKPGDPTLLIATVKQAAQLVHDQNPNVAVYLMATWTRADQTYLPTGHWYNKPIDAMEKDIRAGYNQAAAAAGPLVKGVIPVGESWNRAIDTGVADSNPYRGTAFGRVDLWAYDHYHGSSFGYYLEALTIFGRVTGHDPRSFGRDERCAYELGLSPDQAAALQKTAYDQLTSEKLHLQPFTPHPAHFPLAP